MNEIMMSVLSWAIGAAIGSVIVIIFVKWDMQRMYKRWK